MRFVAKYIGAIAGTALVALIVQVLPHEARTRVAVGQNQSVIVVRGPARVIDGDTLDVAGERVRLEGIDAPEIKQSCPLAGQPNGTWPAGRVAAKALRGWVRDREVACRQTGRDRYGRMLGRCRAGGIDLNAAMIRHGLAWAFLKYSQTFAAQERTARAAALGYGRHRVCRPGSSGPTAGVTWPSRHRQVARSRAILRATGASIICRGAGGISAPGSSPARVRDGFVMKGRRALPAGVRRWRVRSGQDYSAAAVRPVCLVPISVMSGNFARE